MLNNHPVPASRQPHLRFFSWCARSCGCGLVVLALLCNWQAAFAQKADSPNEYQLKAVFIYNFSKFIEWPASAFADSSAGFQICVVGDNPFGNVLESLSNRSYQTHPILIKYPQTITEAKSCHILYINDISKSTQWRDIVKNLGDSPILTVSSSDDATQSGISIGFVTREGKIRWTINLNSTRKAQLKVSAKLVEIAISIIGETSK